MLAHGEAKRNPGDALFFEIRKSTRRSRVQNTMTRATRMHTECELDYLSHLPRICPEFHFQAP